MKTEIYEMETIAEAGKLPELLSFVEQHLEEVSCPPKTQIQIAIAAEEIFVNIANYAYAPVSGTATVRVEVSEEPIVVTITFMDHGKPFDPTKKDDPDVKLSTEERNIGGLGIFMTKTIMDEVSYEYKDGKNILTMKKRIRA